MVHKNMAFGVKPEMGSRLAAHFHSTVACCLAHLSQSFILCKNGSIMPTSLS